MLHQPCKRSRVEVELAVGDPLAAWKNEIGRRQPLRGPNIDARRIELQGQVPDAIRAGDDDVYSLVPDKAAARDGIALHELEFLNPAARDGELGRNDRPAAFFDPRVAPGRKVLGCPA